MANDYYTSTSLVRNTQAKAEDINTRTQAIESGFGKLPAPYHGDSYAADSGAANAYVVTLTAIPTAYSAGLSFRMKAAYTNTGASTVNVNGLGAKSITTSSGTAIAADDIVVGGIYQLVYDGANFQLNAVISTGATLLDEDDMASDSATAAASQQSVKAYGFNIILREIAAKTANYTALLTDKTKVISYTGTYTLSFDPAATLGDGWFCYVKNAGSGDITLDPDSAETIDSLTTFKMYPGEVRLILCDGIDNFTSIVINSFFVTYESSDTFTVPPGYLFLGTDLVGGGGGGGGGETELTGNQRVGGGGGGGGARYKDKVKTSDIATTTVAVTVAGTASGGAAETVGTNGGDTSFGSYSTAYGGGGGDDGAANTNGGGGGGSAGAGDRTIGTGGLPSSTNFGAAVDTNQNNIGGGGGGGAIAAAGGNAEYGGGGGGGAIAPANADGFDGGSSIYGPGGGGGGGGADSDNVIYDGGDGGDTNSYTIGGGGAGGVGGGTAGTNGSDGTDYESGQGGGGGAGYNGTGGIGGNGGVPGGGGGGGGGGNTGNSGGDGAAGEARIWGII